MIPFSRVFALVTAALLTGTCFAQEPENAQIEKQFLRDEWRIWTSPAHVRRKDIGFLGALAASSAVLFKEDRSVSEEVAETDSWTRPSHAISSLGGAIPMLAAPAGIFVIGKVTHHNDAATTGVLSLTAVAHAELVVQAMKQITGRQRPTTGSGLGLFRKGGSSFPSGHAMSSWAFATVVARRSHSKWIKLGSYSFATAVGLSRIGGRNHFPSDVLVGSAGGYLIGRYITRR